LTAADHCATAVSQPAMLACRENGRIVAAAVAAAALASAAEK